MVIRSHHGVHAAFALAALVLIVACAGDQQLAPGQVGPPRSSLAPAPSVTPAKANREIILATTTSTQDSGLLDVLIPIFEERTGYQVKPIAVGSGQALALGERGEADVLLTHSPEAEARFLAAGYGAQRRLVMHNDFVLVGPPDDPAGVSGLAPTAALPRIAERGARFVSRGDDSGTHQLERRLWQRAGIDPLGRSWYQEVGQGMGQTLTIAAEQRAYTLTDRGTLLARPQRSELAVLVQGDPDLLNVYHVIEVSPDRFPKVNEAGARAFADFLVGPEAQAVIAGFGQERYGQPLFVADAGKDPAGLGGSP